MLGGVVDPFALLHPTGEEREMRRVILTLAALMALAAPAWPQQRSNDVLPAFGEYVYVEELPEAITKVEPVFPDAAKRAGVAGTVMTQVLVNREGNVVDARIVKSIPMLDQVALDAIRQWRFKPAMSNGQPVAVWVAVRLKFGSSPPPAPPTPPAPRRIEYLINGGKLAPGDRYAVNGDTSRLVIVVRAEGGRVWLQSPGQWDGSGVASGDSYQGDFTYRSDARDRRNRGAHGEHFGAVSLSGRWTIRGVYSNRMPVGFEETWTPLQPRGAGHNADPRQRISEERLREIPVEEMLQHPLWPPEGGRAPGPDYEHPVWPPEWFKGDFRVMPADRSPMDALPEVLHRVEPGWRNHPRGREARVDELVVVRLRVDADGAISEPRIARSVPAHDQAALSAVRQWRFRPATAGGRPVPVEVYVPVRFKSP
jgi:TonB family protein